MKSEMTIFFIRTGATLSSKLTRASEVLGLIDTKRMAKTCVRFPLHLTLDMEESDASLIDDQLYDPRFFLPLTAQVCRPGAFVDRHLKLVESGALGEFVIFTISPCWLLLHPSKTFYLLRS